jgi:serine/threonine-protein kinase
MVNKLGRYDILGELGRGAMSVVYEARDMLTDAVVALKVIDPLVWGQPASGDERLLFVSDAIPGWRLKHPNIVTVHDVGDADGKVYIAMERLEANSLRRVLDESGPLGMARSARVVSEIACGLAYAHEQGVVHHHVKPSNILLLAADRPKITDFGMARLSEAAIAAGRHSDCLSYMSPEQIRCDGAIDGRSDIFSLGVVFYEMLTGRLPFNGNSPSEILRAVLEAEPPLPSEVDPDVPPEVDGMVLCMLAKDPDDRVANAETVVRGLQRLEEKVAVREAPGEFAVGGRDGVLPLAGQLAPAKPERRFLTYAVIAALLAEAGLIAWRQWQDRPDSSVTQIAATNPAPAAEIAATNPEPAVEIAATNPERAVEIAPSSSPASSLSHASVPPLKAEEPKSKTQRASKSPARKAPKPAVAAASAAAPPLPPVVELTPKMVNAERAQVRTGGGPGPKTAKVVLAVSPWGEIYVDGKLHGTTPPITTLDLAPGRHRIEVRNSAQPPRIMFVTLQAGSVQRIRHDFE